ncbi:MAG: glutaminyl-peptide cyclotransferase, partial [Bacteroidota bacterium]|nr:glutaminyl-peptide cyclotransferase [Bacteroidota bacterium]
MKSEYGRFVALTSIFILITWIISCSGRTGGNPGQTASVKAQLNNSDQTGSVIMDSPGTDAEYKLREEIKVSISTQPASLPVDSVRIFFDGRDAGLIKSAPWRYILSSSANLHTGRKSVKAVVYSRNKVLTATHFIVVYSDIAPKSYHYKVIHTYPHDKEAFTQGLFYDEGVLFEGTGQEAGSSLRQVELTTGKVIKQT